MKTKGIIYWIMGEKKHEMDMRAAVGSLREHMPKIPITVFSDRKIKGPFQVRLFRPNKSKEIWLDRIDCLSKIPYDLNLYMDADMRVYDSLSGMFELLSKYDIAVNHADVLLRGKCPVKGIPAPFPTLAPGVILFKHSAAMVAFFKDWRKALVHQIKNFPKCRRRKAPRCHTDPEALRVALWHSNVKLYILPPEWGFHGYAGYLRDKVRINQISYRASDKVLNENALRARVYVKHKIYLA